MNPIDQLQKKFISNYFIFVDIILGFYILCFYQLKLYNFVFLESISLAIHIILTIVIFPLKFYQTKVYIPAYIISLSVWLYAIQSPVWKFLSAGLLWFFLIPLGLRNIYPGNQSIIIKTSILAFFFAALCILTPSNYTLHLLPATIGEELLFYINLINVVPAILFFFFLQYYYYKLTAVIKAPKSFININIDATSLNRNKQIYNYIESYLEHHQSWKNPEFGLQDLADEIGYDNKDISDAIKFYANMNFSLFLNKYRINTIVEEFHKNDDYSRYNMTYIYSKAGFKNQSTFNQSFKFFMKMTPSEYIKKITN